MINVLFLRRLLSRTPSDRKSHLDPLRSLPILSFERMDQRDKYLNLVVAIVAALGAVAAGWAIYTGALTHIDAGSLTIAGLTVFASCFLRLQLPRLNTHVTITDALLIVSFVTYGGEFTVLLAMLEAGAASLFMRGTGISVRPRTILMNVSVAALAMGLASQAVAAVFGPINVILQRNEITSFVWLIGLVTVCLFVVQSVAAAAYTSIRSGSDFFAIWSENALNAVLVYVTGGVLGGLLIKAVEQANIYLVAAVIGALGLIYLSFGHFLTVVRRSNEMANKAERERAEQAEAHVRELEHYVEEMERSSEALRISHENFRHAAYHDALTGLPNRNYFIDRLKLLLQESRDGSESNFAILLLDLKRFKTINDSLGHSMGDRLIKNVAKRLEHMVREEDMVARFSGDKFGIILTDLMMRDEATAFAERLSKRVGEPYTLDGRQVFTSVRIGIAFGNSRYLEAEDILRDADIAMYYAKDNNEDYVIFDQKMHIRAVTRLQLETDLRFAIERKEFELYYQPIVGLENASLVGFEALVRWNHPQRGLVPPNEFIPISESTGLIVPMTVQILHSACRQLKSWQEQHPTVRPLSVAVNLSGKHFAHPALVDQIKTVLDESRLDPASLKLELTESAVMENAEMAIQMLKQIKETGVQLSIDDFGTGYSSLSYLHRFPIDLLKVDRSFVGAMESNTENGEIVKTVIALAKALNLKVVAEGIESIHQFHQLRILKCEFGQGYLFSKPMKVEDIERLLSDPGRWQNFLPAAKPVPMPPPSGLPRIGLSQ